MSITIEGLSVPENCFRCFASSWYDFGGGVRGFHCRAIPNDSYIVSNVEGRSKRRDDCPIRDASKMYDDLEKAYQLIGELIE